MKQKLFTFLSILAGNALLAFAVCAFVVPNNFMLGGSNGIALALHTFIPLPLSLLNGILNGLLFFVGLIFLGKNFAAGTLLSTVVYPIFMAVFEQLPLEALFTEDKLTCAIFCAVMAGFGIGIVVRAGGATGGMDIPPCILHKYKGIPIGASLMVFDTIIVLAQVFINGLDGVLHSLLIIFLVSMTVNQTVVTGVKKVQLIVISPFYEQIRREILETQDSGVTMLDIETGYEGKNQKAVLCILYAKRYPAIRDAILKLDPHAFIVTSEVKNVNGKGYTLARNLEEKV
ncbi:MAG: YitT family protein [Oscillospiraceae bacterium]|nr:YitT family protein [Oscillospiraceae bacterium]